MRSLGIAAAAASMLSLGSFMREEHHRGSTRYVVHRPPNPLHMDPKATRLRKSATTPGSAEAMRGADQRRRAKEERRLAAYRASLQNYHPLHNAAGFSPPDWLVSALVRA